MAVDLSGVFASRYEEALARARAAEKNGDTSEAARQYRIAAQALQKMTPSLRSASVKKDRQAEAAGLLERAATLEGGGKPRKAERAEEVNDGIDEAVSGMIRRAEVKWEDIAGLDGVKKSIRSAYGMALAAKPGGMTLPSAGNLLLYGPPGTGKTMLAAAVSGSLGATFFAARLSDLLSKYFGESTRIVAALFREAERRAPSVVFLDDFDALVPSRDGDMAGPEKRVLSELLVALDGLEGKGKDRFVLTIAATNAPWLVDEAILSRFGMRVYVPLPDACAREALFKILIEKKGFSLACPVRVFAEKTVGFSGREIENLARIMINDMLTGENPDLDRLVDKPESLRQYTLKTKPLGEQELLRATQKVKPSTNPEMLKRYNRWTERYGAAG